MPGIDWIPIISQVKSLAQAITGDTEGAKRTAENFCKECPGVSQITSVVQVVAGDVDGALETQKRCLGTVNSVANGIPVIGHAKGLVHHAVGDHEGGNRALNAATRSAVIVASGAAAGITTGGLGAIPAGIAAGVGYDSAATVVSGKNQGCVEAFKNAVDNPSAGSIFDALAIPVGDGMAGFSGGQVVNKVKLTKMDAAATTKTNIIKNRTPYFWEDLESGIAASKASDSNVIYIDPNIQEEKIEETENTPAENIHQNQVDALYHDSYVEAAVIERNRGRAQRELRKRDEQTPEGNILETYKNVKFTERDDISKSLQEIHDPNRDPREPNNQLNKSRRQLLDFSWLFLIMPKEFPYTVVAELNSCFRGLYHSFIRHIHDWAEVLPSDFSPVMHRLDPLMPEILAVATANNVSNAEEARKKFIEARRGLNREVYEDVQIALVEFQMAMHEFIQRNMTFDNYLGRSVNTNGQERLYFKVNTQNGIKVMVICVSTEVFTPRTRNEQPIRILVTVFFEPWNVFINHGVLETKQEMQKNKKK